MKLDDLDHNPPRVSEGDIWWASIGDNIGQEINGKGSDFTRPVYICKKLSHSFYLIVPMTSKIKNGSWYVEIEHNCRKSTLCLHQIRVIDYRRLSTRLSKVENHDIERVFEAFCCLYIKR